MSERRDVQITVPDLREDEVIRLLACIEKETGRRTNVLVIVGGPPEDPSVTPLLIQVEPGDDFFERFVPAPLAEEN